MPDSDHPAHIAILNALAPSSLTKGGDIEDGAITSDEVCVRVEQLAVTCDVARRLRGSASG